MINITCCLCKKKYGEYDDGEEKIQESHGYCEPCCNKTLEEIEAMKLDKKTDGQKLVEFCDRMMGH